jgi:hypothetical protein
LGKTAALALAGIARELCHNAQEVADATGLTEDQARRAVTKLRKAGMSEKRGGIYRITSKPLEQVATEFGTLGVGKQQHEQHEHEREEFRTAVESGDLQPGFGKNGLHQIETPKPIENPMPEPVW